MTMKLDEYASYDGLGLAKLVAKKKVSPKELALTAAKAIEAVNSNVGAVVEIYADRIEKLDEKTLGDGPFRGVPFLMKDVFGHEKGRKIEYGSRLCKGMVAEAGTYLADNFMASGVNILGRSAAPEYSMSATTETLLYGNTSTPWKKGHSAGGSSGGAQAAVTSGMVPLAHGSDIGGSIRIPASWCGGVGLKPSRGRVSIGPVVDEGGFGFSANLVQATSVRDVAAMLDCVSAPQVGDPFVIPRPKKSYAKLAKKSPDRLRVGIVTNELFGVKVDSEVSKAVKATGRMLESLGHDVETTKVEIGGLATLQAMNTLFFFGFDSRLDAYAKKAGTKPGPDTLEPCILTVYEWAKTITPAQFMMALGAANVARRSLSKFWTDYDIWLSPTTSMVSPPWGTYHLSKKGVTISNFVEKLFAEPCQYTIPHNIMGTPAMSLPLAMHSNGLPIGVQIAAAPAREHVVLQVAAQLEDAMPWRDRVPPLHVSNV
jgi:amidase